MVHEYFAGKIESWNNSYYEYAEDLALLNESVRHFVQTVETEQRKTSLKTAKTKANALHVAMQIMRFYRPDFPLFISEIQRIYSALSTAEATGDIVPEIHSALGIMVAAESAAWFVAHWTQGKDTTSSSANTEDIRRAYLWLKESGQKPTKENVAQTLRDWEKTIGNDRLNAELSRLRQKSESGPPNKPD